MISDYRDLHFSSTKKIDQILGVYTGSVTLNNTGSLFTFARYNLATNPVGETCFIKGIISFDSGSSWQAVNWFGHIPVAPNTDSLIYPAVFSDTISIIAAVNGTGYTIQYRLFIFAKPGQSPQTPPVNIVSDVIFDSRDNYQKIAFDERTSATSYAHNLGYVPKVSIFTVTSFGGNECITTYGASYCPIIDTTSVTMRSGYETNDNYYRIYYDD
jgi:hypothetical protein